MLWACDEKRGTLCRKVCRKDDDGNGGIGGEGGGEAVREDGWTM